MRVLYVAPMRYGNNDGVDALGHGLQSRLAESDIDLRVIFADFREETWRTDAEAAVAAGVEAGVDAIVVWVIDEAVPKNAVAAARAKGIPVIALERPHYEVDACVVYPNFNQGVYISEYLGTLLPKGARVALVGGPDVVDDIELLMGMKHGINTAGLTLVNDPEDPRYKNASDVAAGGKEKVANILADFDQLDGLIPFNDETVIGAVEALKEAGRLGEMKMVSRNGTPKVVQLVRDGIHQGTWDLDIPGIGLLVADLVVRALVGGEKFNGLIMSSQIGQMLDAETIKTWVTWRERVPYNPLIEGLD